MDMNEMKFCQSCGMPLSPEIMGSNADGSKSDDYCTYCYKGGAFTGDFTMEEMVEFCSQYVDQYNQNSGQNLSRDEYKNVLRGWYPSLKRWSTPADQLPQADSPLKKQFIKEVNDLKINGLPEITNLFIMDGAYINLEFNENGFKFKLLDDSKTYWATQIDLNNGFCFGIACDEKFILVSKYGKDGTNPELIAFKKR